MRCVCCILFLLLTLPLSAQEGDARPLTLNDEAVVTITANNPAPLILDNATAGAVITITARAVDNTQVDPVLWLVDSESRLLAYNHNTLTADGLIEVAAAIPNLVLPTVGLYTIYV